MSFVFGPMTVVPVGDEIVWRIGVVAPTTPIRSPPSSITVYGAILRVPAAPPVRYADDARMDGGAWNSEFRSASPAKFRLALRYGNWTPGQVTPAEVVAAMILRTSRLPRSNS